MRTVLLLLLAACATAPNRAQAIARDLAACLSMPEAWERNAAALACMCRAEASCEAIGMYRGCAWDEWPMATEAAYPTIVGVCE